MVYHSLPESNALQLKIGRCKSDSANINFTTLKKILINDNYDCCILKVIANYKNIFKK